jgi:CRISPR-associated protein Cmr2
MKFVLAISIGPVAHFIAAGRRSRDLWYGSTWLSETTCHVARFLNDQGAELLSPTKERLQEILNEGPQKHGGRVSNKILALVTPDQSNYQQSYLQVMAANCRTKAREFLISQLGRIPSIVNNDDAILHRKALEAQIDAIRGGDFIEFAAAWAPVPQGQEAFGGAVSRACELRDRIPKLFVNPSFSRSGVARSDIDEGRDTVLCPEKQTDGPAVRASRARLGLIESEELDAIALLRRLSPRLGNGDLGTLPFPPVTRVAVDAWLEGCALSPQTKPVLEKLRIVMHDAMHDPEGNFFIWGTPSDEPHKDERFPYESSVLLENGCEALRKSVQHALYGEPPWPAIDKTLRNVDEHVRKLYKFAGLPIPYYAFIEMDGDGIGDLLKSKENPDDYKTCVQALDAFAKDAADFVEGEGTAFYVAADELAAYVPLDKALDVVKQVAKLFDKSLPGKTMSAGIVIAHARDDLRGVRRAAHEALGKAKEARKNEDSKEGFVCLREMPRAGSDRESFGPLGRISDNIQHLVQAIGDGRISLRTEQHLRDHLARFQGVIGNDETPPPGVLLAQDAVRKQFKRSGDTGKDDPLKKRVDGLNDWKDVEHLANEIRMASRIADVRAQRGKTS